MDGHHKLGLWGIVIHGITDGFDRVVSMVDLKLCSHPIDSFADNWDEGVDKQYCTDSTLTVPECCQSLWLSLKGPW